MTGSTSEYDFNSAVTFLLVGLGIGSVLAMLFKPRQEVLVKAVKSINERRTAASQPHEAEERIA